MLTPRVLPAALAATLGALVVIVVPGSASADTRGDWATWPSALDGDAGAWTTTVVLPGPETPTATVTSNAGAADLDPGGSTWLAAETDPGRTHGTSRGREHLVLGATAPAATAASVTTYEFDVPAPVGWTLVLGDVDPDRAVVTGTLADGRAATADQLGRTEPFDYCDVPAPGPSACADASGTVGAAVSWHPTVPLAEVTVTYDGRGDQATYRTWLASAAGGTSAASTDDAAAEPDLDVLPADLVDVAGSARAGTAPVAGVELTLADAADELVAEATSDASGAFVLGDVSPGDLTLTITPPDGYRVVGDEQRPLTVPTDDPVQVVLARTGSTPTDPDPSPASPTDPDRVDVRRVAAGGPAAAADPAVPVQTVVTTTPTTTGTPVTALPATGGPAAALPWWGLVLLLGGGALVATSRRTAQGASR